MFIYIRYKSFICFSIYYIVFLLRKIIISKFFALSAELNSIVYIIVNLLLVCKIIFCTDIFIKYTFVCFF